MPTVPCSHLSGRSSGFSISLARRAYLSASNRATRPDFEFQARLKLIYFQILISRRPCWSLGCVCPVLNARGAARRSAPGQVPSGWVSASGGPLPGALLKAAAGRVAGSESAGLPARVRPRVQHGLLPEAAGLHSAFLCALSGQRWQTTLRTSRSR